jgi:hypothetical protein
VSLLGSRDVGSVYYLLLFVLMFKGRDIQLVMKYCVH